MSGHIELSPQCGFFIVFGKCQAVDRAIVDACVALDALVFGKYGFNIAVEAALRFVEGGLCVETQFDLQFVAMDGLVQVHMGDDVSLFFLESMKKKEIEFEIEIDGSISALEFDPQQMEQVIHNLLSNSIKHVPGGGGIKISASPSTDRALQAVPFVSWEQIGEPTFIDISIKDSGSGIPVDQVSVAMS